MAASFTVIDQTASGKAKVEYNGIGTTGYRDLEAGEPVSQQSYAAAKGNEQSEYERDEDGTFTSREVVDDDEDDEEEDDEEEGTPFNYRNLIYGGLIYEESNTDIQLTVWVVNEEPDSSVTFGELRNSWWGNAKGIAYKEIGPIAEDIEIRGTAGADGPEHEKIDPDEVRQDDRPLGKVHGTVMLEKNGKVYEYTVDFDSRTLTNQSVATPPSEAQR